jgi:hypothetical protein
LASPEAISLPPDLTKSASGNHIGGGVFLRDAHRIVTHGDERSERQDADLSGDPAAMPVISGLAAYRLLMPLWCSLVTM